MGYYLLDSRELTSKGLPLITVGIDEGSHFDGTSPISSPQFLDDLVERQGTSARRYE